MNNQPTSFYEHYAKLYSSLIKIIAASEQRLLQDSPDELFHENSNFFAKAYLVSICIYLEAYIQDTAYMYADELNSRLKSAMIPHNFVHWRILKDKDITKGIWAFKDLELLIDKEDLSDRVSGNPGKTIDLFRKLGINLESLNDFKLNKDRVGFIVEQRNKIVHHNDKAADITFSDLLAHINVFLTYMKSIDDAVMENMSRRTNIEVKAP